jgi:hypothetical protein
MSRKMSRRGSPTKLLRQWVTERERSLACETPVVPERVGEINGQHVVGDVSPPPHAESSGTPRNEFGVFAPARRS